MEIMFFMRNFSGRDLISIASDYWLASSSCLALLSDVQYFFMSTTAHSIFYAFPYPCLPISSLSLHPRPNTFLKLAFPKNKKSPNDRCLLAD